MYPIYSYSAEFTCISEDNIKMDLKRNTMELSALDLSQYRDKLRAFGKMVINFRVP